MNLTLGDFGVLGTMLVGTAGLLVTFLRSIRTSIHADQAKFHVAFDKRLSAVETQITVIGDRITEIDKHKVSHADWVRVATSQLNRQNRLSEQIAELSGKLDATVGIGANMKRIADALLARGQS